MKPYVVDIEEHYHRSVVVYANSPSEAEDLVNELCDCGDIDLEHNCYAGRDVYVYPANENDLEIYDAYWFCADGEKRADNN